MTTVVCSRVQRRGSRAVAIYKCSHKNDDNNRGFPCKLDGGFGFVRPFSTQSTQYL